MVEPDAGPGPLYALLRSARRSVDVEIYELEDDQAEAILAADAERGVRVRVLLDEHYVGRYNRPAFAFLQSHGVAVRWAPSRFDLTHEKAIVVDGRRAAIMSMNLTARYYASTRDFVLLDGVRADVAAVATTFDDDWTNGGLPASSPAGLVWSPGAQDALVALIDSARHQLLVENEEMDDDAVTSALQAAARRGVKVEVVMTRESSWAAAFSALARGGVVVRTYSPSASLYIHAKAIVVDPGTARARAFVGSQNFSVASLLYNRELGLVTSRPAIVAALAAVIARDGAARPPGGRESCTSAPPQTPAVRRPRARTTAAQVHDGQQVGMRQVKHDEEHPLTTAALPEPVSEPGRDPRRVPAPVRDAARGPQGGRRTTPRAGSGCALSLSVAAAASALPVARDQAHVFLRGFSVPERTVFDVVLCMQEVCKNAIRFSGTDRDIDVTVGVSSTHVHLVIRDHGAGFEPRPVDVSSQPDPFVQHGRGLFLLHSLMDDVRIERDGGAVVIARLRIAD